MNYDKAAKYHAQNSTEKLRKLADAVLPDSSVVLDIGANCGLFAGMVALHCPAAVVHAFEPSDELLPIIRMNCGDSVKIHPLAVGETDGEIDLFVNPASQQTNSTIQSAVAMFTLDKPLERRSVRQVSVDSFCQMQGIRAIDAMKVDVQGAEGSVFRGARQMLPATRLLLIESTWMQLDSVTSLIPFAKHYGFTAMGVVNPVHLGADLILARSPEQLPAGLAASFDLRDEVPSWL